MNEFIAGFDSALLDSYATTVPVIIAGFLAVVGLFVAYQGYRGYMRNRNRTLLFLTVGILFLTAIPFVIKSWIRVTDALTLLQGTLVSQLLTIIGLIIILYAFTST
ncbi:DUF7521 family protein [Halocatena salina]|uniref:Uncharacterized protein n=1 Tax=Halocatena salina TaxID=2934340 RepID=A0A8U0A6V6_9EURY|nr:hypothetical protein [Halocatena salina]UPM44734.1 hypothetical protein MW046_17040 [Halocatena salina]